MAGGVPRGDGRGDGGAGAAQPPARRSIQTVAGPVDPAQLGVTLMHEHVLVDFIGAAEVSPSRYDADVVFARALPFLRQAKALGGATLVECTPAYLGRDARLLRRLAEASGLHILSNTGYYGANKDKHLPPHAFTETPQQLAARWIRECEQGIDGTGIKPGFMKIGVDAGPLSEVDAKLVRAAAITHKATGLPIAVHTGNGVAALEEIDILERDGVPLSSFIWVHAHSEPDGALHQKAAARGAWVEFDGISPEERRPPRRPRAGDARGRPPRSRPGVTRRRLVSRRRAGRRRVPRLRHALHHVRAGAEGGRPDRGRRPAAAGRQPAAGVDAAPVAAGPGRPDRLAGRDQHRVDHVDDPVRGGDVRLRDSGGLQLRPGQRLAVQHL